MKHGGSNDFFDTHLQTIWIFIYLSKCSAGEEFNQHRRALGVTQKRTLKMGGKGQIEKEAKGITKRK